MRFVLGFVALVAFAAALFFSTIVGLMDGFTDASNLRYARGYHYYYLAPPNTRGARFIRSLPSYRFARWLSQ